MKKLTFLTAFVVLVGIAKAQQKNYTETIDSLFANISKTEITTGILYDRVFPVSGLHVFNSGVSDTSAAQHFKQAWHELFSAAYNNSGMLKPDTLYNRIGQKVNNGLVPIGLINYKFNYHWYGQLPIAQQFVH